MITLNNLSKVAVCCYFILLQISVGLTKSQTRIVGGNPTTIDKAPYLVQIRSGGSTFCGGTLISDTFVVTAAHCLFSKPTHLNPAHIVVVGGATKLTDNGIQSKVQRIMIPKSYNNITNDADIAVLKLRKPLIGKSIKPISLCKDDVSGGDPVRLYGWGRRMEDALSIPIQLHTVKVKVVQKKRCLSAYRSRSTVTDNMFCARAHGKDSCSGDSGGPAIVNGQFCGVVSWGDGCARADSPGVYTDVKKFVQFIEDAMKKK